MNKYSAKKVKFDGKVFDSRKEAKRYAELRLLERAGQISNLEMQKRFELIPAQYEKTNKVYLRGEKKGQPKQGRCIEQSVVYVADFCYIENGRQVVEDTKSSVTKTKDYIIKRKLMLYLKGIRIREV